MNGSLVLQDGHMYGVSLWVKSYSGTIGSMSTTQCLGSFGLGLGAGWAWTTFQSGTDWVKVSTQFRQIGNAAGNFDFLIVVCEIAIDPRLQHERLIRLFFSSVPGTRNMYSVSTTFNGLRLPPLHQKVYPQHSGMSNPEFKQPFRAILILQFVMSLSDLYSAPPPSTTPPVADNCAQAIVNPSLEGAGLGFSEGTYPAPSWLIRKMHGGTHYDSNLYVRTGTQSDWFSVYPQYLNLGSLGICELQQPVVAVCPDTLYSFGAWLALKPNSGGDNWLSCALTLSVNGIAVATGDPVTHAVGGGSTGWFQTTGYYLTGPAETIISVEVKRSCITNGTSVLTLGTFVDDITFTPVSPDITVTPVLN
jgi:hypothetical protein